MSVVVVDYGAGNTRSVRAALRRLGYASEVTSDAQAILDAPFVILPGVGSARSAMAHLRATGAAWSLRERFERGAPTLGICLGLQLAMTSSDEDGGVEGLALLEGRVVRLREGRVPRLGWSYVDAFSDAFYFAHSYVVDAPDAFDWVDGAAVAVRRGPFLGVQFHPEKSGPAGRTFLERCLSPA